MSFTKQDLLSLKEQNLKFKENFDKFLQKQARDVKKFMEEQKSLMDTIYHRVDEIIAAKDQDENQQQQIVADALPQKRRKSENGGTKKASKKSRKEPISMKNYFEDIVKNPGLQHLAEAIFSNLNYNDLKTCHLINRSSKSILDNPKFWLKKFIQKGISKQNELDWSKAIQLTKNTNYEKSIALYLKRSIMKENVVDIPPCFIDEKFLKKCQGRSLRYLRTSYVSPYITEDYKSGCIQLLVRFSNCYGPDLGYGKSDLKVEIDDEMCKSASNGHLKVIQALVPLIDNLKTHYCRNCSFYTHVGYISKDININYCKIFPLPYHVKEYFELIKQSQ